MWFEQLSFDREERRILEASFGGEVVLGTSAHWEALDEREREAVFELLDRTIEAFGEDPRSASIWRLTGRSTDGTVHYDLARSGEVVREWDGYSGEEQAQILAHLDELLGAIHGLLSRL